MLEFSDVATSSWNKRTLELREEPPSRSAIRVETEMIGNHRQRGTYRGHEFEADESELFGGSDAGPSPLAYFLGSLGFCEQAQIARNAGLRGLDLEAVTTKVRGHFDPRGGYIVGAENRGFDEIRCQVAIVSPESPDTIDELMRLVEEQCYVLNTLRRACPVHHEVTLNGERLRSVTFGPED